MGDMATMRRRIEEMMASGDLGGMSALLQEYATDDFVEEWPQSGERLSKDAARMIAEQYEDRSGTSPRMTSRRMLGAGDVLVAEATIDYGDGVPVSYVGIVEMRDGKVAKLTEYFASPFEPPAWRTELLQRMQPAAV